MFQMCQSFIQEKQFSVLYSMTIQESETQAISQYDIYGHAIEIYKQHIYNKICPNGLLIVVVAEILNSSLI